MKLSGNSLTFDNIIGQKDNVNKILRYLPRVINQGLPEHFFIIEKHGTGKTSFIRHVAEIAEDKYNMFPIYVNNKGANNIYKLISNLCKKLFEEFEKTPWGKKFIDNFFKHFEKEGLKFKDHSEIVEYVENNFIEFLVEICDNEVNGIFFIIDDVNGLSKTPEFSNWYKGLFETLEFYKKYVPVTFSLIAYPTKYEQLCKQNPSFPSMFNLITLD